MVGARVALRALGRYGFQLQRATSKWSERSSSPAVRPHTRQRPDAQEHAGSQPQHLAHRLHVADVQGSLLAAVDVLAAATGRGAGGRGGRQRSEEFAAAAAAAAARGRVLHTWPAARGCQWLIRTQPLTSIKPNNKHTKAVAAPVHALGRDEQLLVGGVAHRVAEVHLRLVSKGWAGGGAW